jgi:hypothetical protein
MLFRPRFPSLEAQPIDDGDSMLIELDAPLCIKLDATTFESLFEAEHTRRRRSAATTNHKQTTQPGNTIWDLIQEALRGKARSSEQLFQYVTSKGKVTTNMTVGSILQTKRKAGLVDSPDERGGAWQLTK